MVDDVNTQNTNEVLSNVESVMTELLMANSRLVQLNLSSNGVSSRGSARDLAESLTANPTSGPSLDLGSHDAQNLTESSITNATSELSISNGDYDIQDFTTLLNVNSTFESLEFVLDR